jgi:phospholipase/carboxylesterase
MRSLVIDGPRLGPARGGKPDFLVVLLHGYGSNGDDLIGLAPHWAGILPGAQFTSPHAPEPGHPGGRQWFGLTRMDPHEIARGAREAAGPLDRFLTAEMARHGLGPERTALVGFSQGTMMALHVGLRRPEPLAAILGYSGALTDPAALKAEMASRPPVLLVHGDRDDMVPVAATFEAARVLADAGWGAAFHISPGLGHAIAPDGLEAGGRFLQAAARGALG